MSRATARRERARSPRVLSGSPLLRRRARSARYACIRPQVSAQEFAAFLSVEDHPDPEDDRVCDMINARMRKMEVIDLVTFKMNEHLRSESERAGGAHMSWFKMFNEYDKDGTGRIDFDEMHEVIRKELSIPRSKLSEDEYRFLWDHLDQGDDGFIEARARDSVRRPEREKARGATRRGGS